MDIQQFADFVVPIIVFIVFGFLIIKPFLGPIKDMFGWMGNIFGRVRDTDHVSYGLEFE